MVVKNDELSLSDVKEKKYSVIFGAIFSFLVLFANYKIWYHIPVPENSTAIFRKLYRLFVPTSLLFGGAYIGYNVCVLFLVIAKMLHKQTYIGKEECKRRWKYYGFPFVSIVFINLVILFTAKYPGNITNDSISQINQILTGEYTNHHPYFHTQVIKIFFTMGMFLFGNINAAVATYMVFQIIFMASCFSIVSLTLYDAKISRKIIVITDLFYILLPYHIIYSFTMWKDVMFAGFTLLTMVALYRIFAQLSKIKILDYILYTLSSVGICLFRSNGFFIYIFILIAILLLYRVENKKIIIISGIVIVMCFSLKHYYLDYINVEQPDTIEMLSIPTQQICRVIVDHNDLTDEQYLLLNNVIEVDRIESEYAWHSSDPIKALVREKNNQKYIKEHSKDFISLYINLGTRHFTTYIMAWIDETKGYWNGGYNFWTLKSSVYDNSIGIKTSVNNRTISKLVDSYIWLFEDTEILQIFFSIGFYTWITMLLSVVSLVKCDKLAVLLTVPLYANILSLLITTPLYAEFRYVYSNLCLIPILVVIVLFTDSRKMNHSRKNDKK